MAKRILIYTNHFFPENFKVNEIARHFAEEGNFVHVITQVPNYPAGKFHKGYGIFKNNSENITNSLFVRRLPSIPRMDGGKIELFLNYISYFFATILYTFYLIFFKKKYDTLFVHNTSPAFITLSPILYKKIKESKLIMWDLDMWPDTLVALDLLKNKNIESFLERVMKWIYNQYDFILLGSKGFFQKANSRLVSSKIEYFPNWAEDVFTNNDVSIDFIMPESKNFKLMYAGNLGEAQDLENVFNAIVLLKDKPITWIFIGDGRFRERFLQLLSSANISNQVVFLGNHAVEKMPCFFSKSDAMFLSLKQSDIFELTVPAKLQAYMAAGKPILGMLSGEAGDIIKKANCGYVSNSGDFRGFARNVKKLISYSSEDRKLLGKNGKEFYNNNFSFSMRVEQLKRIIDD